MPLFDKHEKPVLRLLTEEAAWDAVHEYEDYVYSACTGGSDEEWDRRLAEVRAYYDEYYALFDSDGCAACTEPDCLQVKSCRDARLARK